MNIETQDQVFTVVNIFLKALNNIIYHIFPKV